MEEIRLQVVVRAGDYAAFNGTFGSGFVYDMKDMRDFQSASRNDHADSLRRWHALDRKCLKNSVAISVPLNLRIGELRRIAMEAARARRPALSEGIETWLTDIRSVTLPDAITVREAELDDGDVIVLCILQPPMAMYTLAPAPDPQSLFRSLMLGAQAPSPRGLPRLWGILLYTDADVELATYVRTHFDELNALSGPAFRVFVLERPESWRKAKRYWRGTLEPSLYRTFGALRWLRWKPYERHRAHDIARTLGIAPDLMPCLVLLRSPDGTSRITFPITGPPTPYLRRLFGEILRTLDITPEPYSIPGAGYGLTWGYSPIGQEDLGSAEADRRAFDLVAAAEERIKRALKPLPGAPGVSTPANTYVFHGYTTVVSEGTAMSDNFNFYGQTTFINRPVDTVIQDFQNNYASIPGQQDLRELLSLVLSSEDLPDEAKEEAATAIHEIAEELGNPQHDKQAVRSRLETLRSTVSRAMDIAAPAMEMISAVLGLLHH